MARMDPLKRDDMTEAQRQAYDKVAARGGRLGGPNGIYVRVPELFEINQEVGDYLLSSSVSPRLRQLAVLVAVRDWNAEYPWAVQARAALTPAIGIERDIVDAINARQKPRFTNADDEAVYAVARELVAHGTLSDASFAAARAKLGFNRLLDLVAIVGFYMAVALVANVFEVDVPPDIAVPLLK